MTPFSWHASATFVSIGIARCGVSPVVLMPYFRSFGSRSSITCETSTMSLRVVGSPPDSMHISMFFQSGLWKTLVDLRERHVGLAVAALPVAAHLAARVADEGAVEDEAPSGWMGLKRAT